MLRALLTVLLLGKVCPSFATGQAPDYLIINSDTLMLFSNPLETLPDKSKQAQKRLNDFNTGCWRGYIGYWRLMGNELYLTNLTTCSRKNGQTVPLAELFGNSCKDGRVLANWFTGELRCVTGRLLRYYHDGYQSVYEYETIYQVQHGLAVNKAIFDNGRTKTSRYETDTKKLYAFVYSHIEWDALPVLPADSVINVFTKITSKPAGSTPVVDVFILKGAGPVWNAEVARVLNELPEWSIEYRRGKFYSTAFGLRISFSEANRRLYSKPK